jgi:hypothetical protein
MAGRKTIDNQRPPQDGEFHYINGIAETTERALHEANILTFEQLASLSLDEIAKALPGQVGVKERAAHFQWQEKALDYAQSFADNRVNGWPYVTFTIRFVMDKQRVVKRTEISWSGDENKKQLTEWDPNSWVEWILDHAQFNLDLTSGLQEPSQDGTNVKPNAPLKISQLQVLGSGSKKSKKELREGMSFILSANLDLGNIENLIASEVRYQGSVQIHKVSGWTSVFDEPFKGNLNVTNPTIVNVSIPGLLSGLYHAQIVIALHPDNAQGTENEGFHAVSDGLLIPVIPY